MKKCLYGICVCCVFCVLCSGCKKEQEELKIEELPVREITISEPPKYEPKPKPETVYTPEGVFKVDGRKYFGAPVPFGFVELGCNEEECRFYVPRINKGDIHTFLDTYFPYQQQHYYPKVSVFEVHKDLKPEFADGTAIVPSLDPNIYRPFGEYVVAIKIYWNNREHRYEWIYKDPSYVPPEPEPVENDEELERMRDLMPE